MIDLVKFTGEQFPLGFHDVVQWNSVAAYEPRTEDELERLVLRRGASVIFRAEYLATADDLHYRRGGWSEALLRKAHERKIAVGFSFCDWTRLHDRFERARVFGRMQYNVRLCRKFKVHMVVASCARTRWEMRGAEDLLSFARVLGMTGREAREAVSFSMG